MAAIAQKKLLALDTNFLLDLAGKAAFARDFKEYFQSLGFQFLVPPTVVMELTFAAEEENGEKRALARKALDNFTRWRIQPFGMTAVETDITGGFSQRLREKGLLPFEEVNDGIILAETSLGGISILITRDKHLLDIDETSLSMAFNDADWTPVNPAHPKRLLQSARRIL
jgi:predicted nucleic acid-binding protein